MRVSLPATSYASPEAVVGFYGRLLDAIRALPGVRTAGAVRSLPLASEIGDWGLSVDGYAPPPGQDAGRQRPSSSPTSSTAEALAHRRWARRYPGPSVTGEDTHVRRIDPT